MDLKKSMNWVKSKESFGGHSKKFIASKYVNLHILNVLALVFAFLTSTSTHIPKIYVYLLVAINRFLVTSYFSIHFSDCSVMLDQGPTILMMMTVMIVLVLRLEVAIKIALNFSIGRKLI